MGQDPGDGAGVVLVDAMQTHDGIQQQEPGLSIRTGAVQPPLLRLREPVVQGGAPGGVFAWQSRGWVCTRWMPNSAQIARSERAV